LKTDLAQRRVRLNIAAFYSDYSDKQEQFFNGVFQVTSNAAAATIKGFEVDLTALPIDWLTLGAAVGYQDATYDDYHDPITGRDFTGNRLPGIPEWTGSLSAQIDQTMSSGWSWMLRGDVAYRDEKLGRASNDPFFVGEAMTLVNARLGFTTPSNRYQISVWAKNLLDKDYEVSRSEIDGLGQYVRMNQPLSWGIELRGRFGN